MKERKNNQGKANCQKKKERKIEKDVERMTKINTRGRKWTEKEIM